LDKILNLRLIFVGLLTGFLTTLPEVSIAINSIFNNTEELALGNLLGGIMVLYGLVLSLSILFNRKIETSGEWGKILPTNVYIFSPFILGLDGRLSSLDGLILIAGYLALVVYLYLINRNSAARTSSNQSFTFKNLIQIIFGLVLIVIVSFAILRLAEFALDYVTFSQFFFGLIIFSIGTNLPEIVVAFRSWKKQSPRLSLGNIFGSTSSNILVIGFLVFFRPLPFIFDTGNIVLAFFILAILVLVSYFYYSGKKFTQAEGGYLLALYLLFVFASLICTTCN